MSQPQESGARVLVMRGAGTDKLREALAAGILDIDTKRAAERVLHQNRMLERENRWLKRQLESTQANVSRLTATQIKAYDEYFDRKKRVRDGDDSRMALLVLGFTAGIVIAIILAAVVMLR